MTKKEIINEIVNEGRFNNKKVDHLIDYLYNHFISILDKDNVSTNDQFNKLVRKTHSAFIGISNKVPFGIPDDVWIKFFNEKIIKLKIAYFPDLEIEKNKLYSLSNKKLHNYILDNYGNEIIFINTDMYYPNSIDIFNLYYVKNMIEKQIEEIQESVSTEMDYIEYSAYNILGGRLKKIKYSVDNIIKSKLKAVNINYNSLAKSIYTYLKYKYRRGVNDPAIFNESELNVISYFFLNEIALFLYLKSKHKDNNLIIIPDVKNSYKDTDHFIYKVFGFTKDEYVKAKSKMDKNIEPELDD